MLEPSSQGYGLVTWVSDPLYWDQIDYVGNIARNVYGQPIFTPAIVYWKPTTAVDASPTDHDEPWLECEIIAAFGAADEFLHTGTTVLNAVNYWDESFNELSENGKVRLPVWAVTPLDEDVAYNIALACNNYWGQFREINDIPWLNIEHQYHDSIEIDGKNVECPAEDWEGECLCDFEARMQAMSDNAESGRYFPFNRNEQDPLSIKFFQAWDWGYDRYMKATAVLHAYVTNKERDETCLSSWVWLQSPFLVTQPSNEWMTIVEPKSSTHLMSSQLSLDYSTAV